jgi:hypothetical protein
MSIRTFDFALAARRQTGLAAALADLSPFLELCRHAVGRQAFLPDELAWSASREPLALSILLRGEPIWTVMTVEQPAPWLVSAAEETTRMTKTEALTHLARVLAASASMSDGVRFEWRSDETIGGAF